MWRWARGEEDAATRAKELEGAVGKKHGRMRAGARGIAVQSSLAAAAPRPVQTITAALAGSDADHLTQRGTHKGISGGPAHLITRNAITRPQRVVPQARRTPATSSRLRRHNATALLPRTTLDRTDHASLASPQHEQYNQAQRRVVRPRRGVVKRRKKVGRVGLVGVCSTDTRGLNSDKNLRSKDQQSHKTTRRPPTTFQPACVPAPWRKRFSRKQAGLSRCATQPDAAIPAARQCARYRKQNETPGQHVRAARIHGFHHGSSR